MKRIAVLNLFFWSIFAIIPGTAWSESDAYRLGGVVEVEAGFVNEDDPAEGDSSDIALATVEIGLDATINKNVEAHMLLLYEDGEDGEFTVDEGTITLTAPYGLTVTAGKMYLPFGMFNSHFISDPQTLELGETNESAILIGYGNDIFDVSVGAFNGDFDDVNVGDAEGTDNKVDDYVVSITVTPAEGITFGASYISDIVDTDAELGKAFQNISGEVYTDVYDDVVAGYSAFVSASFGPIAIEAEYLAAADEFDDTDLDGDGRKNDQPVTFNVEVAYAISEAAELAFRYEGTNDLGTKKQYGDLDIGNQYIEKQYGVSYSRELYENTSFALEYMSGTYDKDTLTDPSEDEVTAITAQLSIEF